jgi:hypothetical protein
MNHRRKVTLITVLMAASAVLGWTLYQAQSSPARPLDQIMPEGALLYIEAKDFGALMKDWNASPEKALWLKSDDYRVFSNSRLFLRLNKASDEFAKAAGVPPNMKFVNDAAGKESALAIYDIGNLEFLYVARMDSPNFTQSPLWQTRNKFQTRMASGKAFYVRKEEESGRVVAFAVVDDYLVLGTRESLVAGALELLAGGKGRAIKQEGWYTKALAAAPAAAGDLRMAMHLEKIGVTPHFRTYWVQQNITEMQGYESAVSDLYREGAAYREERVILPAKPVDDENAVAPSAQAVTALQAMVPKEYGFYRAAKADAKGSLAVVEQKIIAPHFGAAPVEKLAPQVQLGSGQTGASSDLETRIDVEPASRTVAGNAREGLQKQFETAGVQAMLVVQSTRRNSDGVLLANPSVVALSAGNDWDAGGVQRAIQDVLAPGLTASRLGAEWHEVKDAGGYFELDGLMPVQIAARGKLLFIANDAAALSAVLQTRSSSPTGVTYAAGFSHARERENFYSFSSLVDRGTGTPNQPQFFSGNMASFSRSFARVESEEVAVREGKGKIQQTVTYHWTQ